MRKHFVIPIMVALLALFTSQVFAQTTTIVTRSGERFRAQMVDTGNGAGFAVRMNGRERDIPMTDVAMIDFTGDGRSVDQNELDRAGRNGLVVLRNGRTVAGNLVDLQPYSSTAVVSDNVGPRNVPFNQIARIYLGTFGYGSRPYGNYGRNGRNGGQYDPNYDPNGNSGSNGDRYGQVGDVAVIDVLMQDETQASRYRPSDCDDQGVPEQEQHARE